jgi:hypothetical protein
MELEVSASSKLQRKRSVLFVLRGFAIKIPEFGIFGRVIKSSLSQE